MRRARSLFLACVIGSGACTASGIKSGSGTGGSVGAGSGGAPIDGGSGGAAGGDDDTGTGGVIGIGLPDASAPPDAPTCGMQTFALESIPPDLLIVLDRSGSMLQTPDSKDCDPSMPACPATTKWPQVTAAINQAVQQTESTIRWGLKVFPDTPSCGAGAPPAVPVGDKSAAAIAAAITANTPTRTSATPTRAAITGATAYLAALPDTNPRYILLATDGLPTCGMIDAVTLDTDRDDAALAVAAVMDSATRGIPVFVVGIATAASAADATLNMMAMTGGRPRAASPAYYPVSSTADLIAALGMIQRKIASCEFKLAKKPPFPDRVTVIGDGYEIPMSDTTGWDYGPDQMSIVLSGSFCDDVMAGKLVNVEAIFKCVIPEVP